MIGSLRCGGLAEYRSDASDLHPAGQAITTSTAARSSGRWAGFIFSPFSELHTFWLASTDGVRLRLGGDWIIDHGDSPCKPRCAGRKLMIARVLYSVFIEYQSFGASSTARLGWESPSILYEEIPASQLLSLTQSDRAPRTVMVVAGHPCAATSLVRGSALTLATAGTIGCVVITLKDELQNIHRSNFGDVRLTLSTPGGASRVSLGNQLLARPLEDGTLEGCYEPRTASEQLSLSLELQLRSGAYAPLPGSPFQTRVVAGAPCAGAMYMSPVWIVMTSGVSALFTIQANDAYGNTRSLGHVKDAFLVRTRPISNAAGAAEAETKCATRANISTGSIRVECLGGGAGEHELLAE